MDCFHKLAEAQKSGSISQELMKILHEFYVSYEEAANENGYTKEQVQHILNGFLDLVLIQLKKPYPFELYHERVLKPFNYYAFGLDIVRPLIKFSESQVFGCDNLDAIKNTISQGENVILFANHQTEPDPQVISLLLQEKYPILAEDMIFVAGHRVTTDPLAVPFSLGRNLLCIYSKRHIETEPEKKLEKITHNQRTMKKMAQLLEEGGKCIYVAPSGGRDRINPETGKITIPPFDPQSIEMFRLIAEQSQRATHFYPLSLYSYFLLPPPNSVETAIGEKRHAQSTPAFLSFGKEIDMENCIDSTITDKKTRRQGRANHIWNLINNAYLSMGV